MVSSIIPKRPRKVFVPCPVWHTPDADFYEIVDGGLVFKCPSCHKIICTISRAYFDQIWDALAHGSDKALPR